MSGIEIIIAMVVLLALISENAGMQRQIAALRKDVCKLRKDSE